MTIRPRHSIRKIERKEGRDGIEENKEKEVVIDNVDNLNEKTNVSADQNINIDAKKILQKFSTLLYGCIISLDDVYTVDYQSTEIVARVAEIHSVKNSIEDEEEDDDEGNEISRENKIDNKLINKVQNKDKNEIEESQNGNENENEKGNENDNFDLNINDDIRRGIIDTETEIYIELENTLVPFNLKNYKKMPPENSKIDLINIYTKDNEHFPVVRKLLRPCISLTSIVQEGKGIYNHDINNNINVDNSNDSYEHTINDNNNNIDTNSSSTHLAINENTNREEKNELQKNLSSSDCTIEVDACTFDKVLLYLEHEVRTFLMINILT